MRNSRRTLKRGLALAALAALVAAAPASAAKLHKYRYELTEFSGQSQAFTTHSIYPCTPNVDQVENGTLQGSFSSARSRIEGVKIGRSDAKGKITADAAPTTYQQDGVRTTDQNPCGSDEPGTTQTSCARPVVTVPGIVGRFTDATKKKVEIDWEPSFDGNPGRFTPDFLCIERLGPIPMRTIAGYGDCSQRSYPRHMFDSADFELLVDCTMNYAPLAAPGGFGAYNGSYHAELTLEAVEEN